MFGFGFIYVNSVFVVGNVYANVTTGATHVTNLFWSISLVVKLLGDR